MAPRERRPALAVPGFRAAGVHCGIKARGLDLALIAADTGPVPAAGVFTRSTVVGAPVEVSRERVRSGRARAVVVNSGISNVAMGARGVRDARETAALVARELGCPEQQVLVASTGVIGVPLPMARLRRGIPEAVRALRRNGLARAARAIMTTDTRPKRAVVCTRVAGRAVTVAGIAKGAGMVEPNLATMLAYLLTDAAVSPAVLRRILRETADRSFNRLTIDGETSTSDTVLLLASGAAGNAPIRSATSAAGRALARAVEAVAIDLTRQLAADGEGATKLVTVRVRGARNAAEAERAARRIANSLLVKTAIHGRDPNWGRILQTLGAGRVAIDLGRAEVRLAGVPVFRRGRPLGAAARRRAAAALRGREVSVEASLGAGRAEAGLWTCDLSADYVRINAEYTT